MLTPTCLDWRRRTEISRLHAIVLGIVQGLSEFLPISSSGHLILVPWLFGWERADRCGQRRPQPHLRRGPPPGDLRRRRPATSATDLLRLAAAAWTSLRRRSVGEPDERLAWLLALSALPGATVGAVLEATVADHLGQIWLIGILLIVGAVVLVRRRPLRGDREGRPSSGSGTPLVMGRPRPVALAPGVSRSGITITAGLFIGFDRDVGRHDLVPHERAHHRRGVPSTRAPRWSPTAGCPRARAGLRWPAWWRRPSPARRPSGWCCGW